MKRQNNMFVLLSAIFSIFLAACSLQSTVADEGEAIEEVDLLVNDSFYNIANDKIADYLSVHEGTWAASLNSEVAIIIENDSVYVGLNSGSNVYRVSSCELKERQYISNETNYEVDLTSYTLSLNVPEAYKPYVGEMEMIFTYLEETIPSNYDYGFIFKVGTDDHYTTYIMERSKVEYSKVDSQAI